ncbi:MAG: hypothetical protein AAF433_17355, partial [Bacteroidota bacterium]
FGVQVVEPQAMTIDLGDYFYGRGERSLFLYTEITALESVSKWLCLGHGNYATIFLNGQEIFSTSKPLRRWPGAEWVMLQLQAGSNQLVLRLDVVNDDFRLDIGLKEQQGRHPHQSQWETQLNFQLTDELYQKLNPT